MGAQFFNKLKSLYLPPHSFREYGSILNAAKEVGYTIISLKQFVEGVVQEPYLILRHDIDTDPKAALRFAELETRYEAGASYFFRLCTWDDRVVRTLDRGGFEVGYHYEETTSYALRYHIRDRDLLRKHFPEIRRIFGTNLNRLRERSGLALDAIASHGDFTAQILDIGNDEAMQDLALRKSSGIKYEVYDSAIWDAYKNHISDDRFPPFYKLESPMNLIDRKESFLFLTHPRWWRSNPLCSLKSDLRTSWQKLWY